jgi:tight adherence protein C
MLLILLAILFLAVAGYMVAEAVTAPARERETLVKRAGQYGRLRLSPTSRQRSFHERVTAPAGERLAGFVLRTNPKATLETVNAKLMSAGLGRTISPTGFLASKAVLALVGLTVCAIFGGAFAGPLGGFLFGICGLALGFIAPDMVVGSKARRRKERIRSELPDALDLLAVSVEAGLGFDGALARITERSKGPLLEELSIVLHEMRIGESRIQALKNFAERLDMPETTSFARSIIQAEQLGMALGRILRVQASDSRQKRQMWAEEKAMKAPIKMLFPTVIFIFPAMFIVILGPAMLQLLKLFKGI